MTDQGATVLDQLVAAVQANPDVARSFVIPPFNGSERIVVHKGLPGGHVRTTVGVVDELVQGGFLARTHGQLHELTDRAYERQRAATIPGRVSAAGRETWKVVVAAASVVVAIVAVLTWLGITP